MSVSQEEHDHEALLEKEEMEMTDDVDVKAAKKVKEIANPLCKINRDAKIPLELRAILSKLDGEGEAKKKTMGRTKKQELETILNTTHSIKTFALIDEEK